MFGFQIAELKRGAEIIVCTPGRMIDMLTANNGGSYLDVTIVTTAIIVYTKFVIVLMHC